jgi:hypothetical protein
LLDARQAAIAELKALDGKERGIADFAVVRLSGARMLVEALTLRMLAGDAVAPAELQAANDMVDAALEAAGTRTHTIELMTSHGAFDTCPQCGFTPPPAELVERVPGERFVDTFRRYALERDTTETERPSLPVSVASGGIVESTEHAPPAVSLPKTPEPPPVIRDTRPNAPAPSNGAHGSAIWFGGAGDRYPLVRES